MKKLNAFKQKQMESNIIEACSRIEMFLSTRCKTIKLLQCILPIGWKITPIKNGYRYIERSFQASQSDFYNVYMTLKNRDVMVYQYYESEFNKDFTTIRINLVIDKDENITFLN